MAGGVDKSYELLKRKQAYALCIQTQTFFSLLFIWHNFLIQIILIFINRFCLPVLFLHTKIGKLVILMQQLPFQFFLLNSSHVHWPVSAPDPLFSHLIHWSDPQSMDIYSLQTQMQPSSMRTGGMAMCELPDIPCQRIQLK